MTCLSASLLQLRDLLELVCTLRQVPDGLQARNGSCKVPHAAVDIRGPDQSPRKAGIRLCGTIKSEQMEHNAL